jgi:site-specific DNA-adenine methylase
VEENNFIVRTQRENDRRFLKYPGGKSRTVNLILKIIPDFKEYRELFLGGGSIFMCLK